MTGIAQVLDNASPVELNRPIFRRFDEIETEPVVWLWPGRIATKLNMLVGNPGKGKSQISVAIGACVTVGGRWPDKTPCEKGSVIFICSEDDAGDTIKPRLEAAGADVSKVYILDAVGDDQGQKQWSLEHDADRLEELIEDIGDVRLVVIDPISAYLGQKDGHSTTDVRGALQPLSAICSRRKVCVLMISHLNKAAGMDAMSRVTGSGAFVAASRVVYMVGDHPDDESARVMVPLKNNLGDDRSGFAYDITPVTLASGIESTCIHWQDGVVELHADDVLARPREAEDLDANTAKGEAAAFLIDVLRNGAVPSKQIFTSADEAGIAKRTLDRAKKALQIRSVKLEFAAGWHWELPTREVDKPGELQGSHDGHVGDDCQGCHQGGPHKKHGNLGALGNLGSENDAKDAKDAKVFVSANTGTLGDENDEVAL